MNTKQTEALKLALEALKGGLWDYGPGQDEHQRCNEVIAICEKALADGALDRMAENARELGLDYEPPCKTGSQCTSKCPQCEQPAQQEPVAWRELCRRLYIELYWCDRQMMETLDEDGEPRWTQGKEVRDILADAKAALETSPPASKPWVGLTDEEVRQAWQSCEMRALNLSEFAAAIEAKLREKNA